MAFRESGTFSCKRNYRCVAFDCIQFFFFVSSFVFDIPTGIVSHTKLLVPKEKVVHVIQQFHGSQNEKECRAHFGFQKTYKMITEKHAGVTQKDVLSFIKLCQQCQKYNPIQKSTIPQPIISTHIMERVVIDLIDMKLYGR
jgi:hypothetical protein